MGGFAGGQFVEPHDLVHGDIGANANDGFVRAVLYQKIAICDATIKR